VTSVDAAGNPSSAAYRFMVDTVADVAVGAVAGNNVVNASEAGGQIAVTGTAEIGTTSVSVTWGGHTFTASVNPTTGAWSANVPANTFGSMQATNTLMQVNSTDAYGNVGIATRTVVVDTLATVGIGATQALDNKINANEAAAGVTLTGTSDPNSTVVVNFAGQNVTVTSDATGAWSANFSLSGLGAMEGTRVVTATATDANGNVSSTASHSVTIDTLAPNDPFVTGEYLRDNVIRGISTETAAGDYTYHAVGTTGAASQLTVSSVISDTGTQENGTSVNSEFALFTTSVPDGSYLVIRDVDTAGNESSTLYLRATTEVNVDLTRAGLSGFDFGTIDLTGADANLTLNAATIARLTGADKQLTITGNGDDVVNLQGATAGAAGTNVTAHGETYKLYTLAGGASVLIDDEITVNLTV
jgi:hypothetical protein